jgi:hypothetical protein
MRSDETSQRPAPTDPQPTQGRVEGGKSPAAPTARETTAQQLHPAAAREGAQEGGHRAQRPG